MVAVLVVLAEVAEMVMGTKEASPATEVAEMVMGKKEASMATEVADLATVESTVGSGHSVAATEAEDCSASSRR